MNPSAAAFFKKVFESWVANDPTAAAAWFEGSSKNGQLPTEHDIYNYAAAEVVGAVAQRDLADAWELIEVESANIRAQTMMIERAGEAISNGADWERMAALATSSDDEKLQRTATSMLALPNFKHDTPTEQIARATSVLETHPDLAATYAEQALRKAGITGSPDLADWALPRLHPDQRDGLLGHYIGQWAKRDPDAVRKWAGDIAGAKLRAVVEAALGS